MDQPPATQGKHPPEKVLENLEHRVHVLERRCSYLWIGLVFLVSLGGIVTFTGFSSRVPETIRAHEFEVVDDSGFVQGRFRAGNGYAILRLGSPGLGKRVVVSSLDYPQIYLTSGNMNEPGNARLDLTPRRVSMRGPEGSSSVQVDSIGPRVILADKNWWFEPDSGYRAVLGAVRLEVIESGTKIERTPSSLVLFDEEQEVLWAAPRR